jgi:hypothetical protein
MSRDRTDAQSPQSRVHGSSDPPERFLNWQEAQYFSSKHLTSLSLKSALYGLEPTYREALSACAGVIEGNGGDLANVLRNVGVGLFRPDAIAHDKSQAILSFLERLGIRPFFACQLDLSGMIVREVWRYQLNAASGERLRLLDLVFGGAPSVIALFEVADQGSPVPCTVLMADSKGEAIAADRQGWELRSHLDSPNRIEVYFHSSDEPADVVRDAGIILGPERFARALAYRGTDATKDIQLMAHSLVATVAARRLVSPEGTVSSLSHALRDNRPQSLVDRWDLIRSLAGNSPMHAGPSENIIAESGTDAWWGSVGLLGTRSAFLSSRTGWAGSLYTDRKGVAE